MLISMQAFATQSVTNAIDPTTETGSQLATDLNNSFTSILSTNRGTSRPSYAVAGTMWINPVSGTFEAINIFDGSNDLAIASYNPTTHVFTLANSFPSSATLPGSPTTTTQSASTNNTTIATTAQVHAAIAAASLSGVLHRQDFTSSGTFTAPTGTISTTAFLVYVTGAAGSTGCFLGGGTISDGGGGTAIGIVTGLSAGTGYTITVGSGGGGGNCVDGGNSTAVFGATTLTGNGGQSDTGPSCAGGSASGGSVENISGGSCGGLGGTFSAWTYPFQGGSYWGNPSVGGACYWGTCGNNGIVIIEWVL